MHGLIYVCWVQSMDLHKPWIITLCGQSMDYTLLAHICLNCTCCLLTFECDCTICTCAWLAPENCSLSLYWTCEYTRVPSSLAYSQARVWLCQTNSSSSEPKTRGYGDTAIKRRVCRVRSDNVC